MQRLRIKIREIIHVPAYQQILLMWNFITNLAKDYLPMQMLTPHELHWIYHKRDSVKNTLYMYIKATKFPTNADVHQSTNELLSAHTSNRKYIVDVDPPANTNAAGEGNTADKLVQSAQGRP